MTFNKNKIIYSIKIKLFSDQPKPPQIQNIVFVMVQLSDVNHTFWKFTISESVIFIKIVLGVSNHILREESRFVY